MQFFRFLTGARAPLIDRTIADLAVMLDTSAEMFAAATGCRLDNEPLAVDIAALDARVNDGGLAVRRAVLEYVTVPRRTRRRSACCWCPSSWTPNGAGTSPRRSPRCPS